MWDSFHPSVQPLPLWDYLLVVEAALFLELPFLPRDVRDWLDLCFILLVLSFLVSLSDFLAGFQRMFIRGTPTDCFGADRVLRSYTEWPWSHAILSSWELPWQDAFHRACERGPRAGCWGAGFGTHPSLSQDCCGLELLLEGTCGFW